MSRSYVLNACRVLTPDGFEQGRSLYIHEGRFVDAATPDMVQLDAAACTVYPGIIDLHGDAFERELAPRPGVEVPVEVALAATDAALVAHGITTFFYALTDGFEPGIRSRATVRAFVAAIESARAAGQLRCDSRLHLRHERVNTDAHAELLDWIHGHRIDLLSLNDHLPGSEDERRLERYASGLRQRVKMAPEAVTALIDDLQRQGALGPLQEEELARAAAAADLPLASHDDDSAERVRRSAALGVRIAEFPTTIDLARSCRAAGAAVMFGAPNLLRGRSHLGLVAAADAVAAGVCDLLVSDYHFPSLLRAPFIIVEQGLLPLERAWDLVSAGPAAAVGLGDRKGRIVPGYEADCIVMNGARGLAHEIQAVFVGGRPVSCRLPMVQHTAATGI